MFVFMHIENNDLHISAQAFADAVTLRASALQDLENRLGFTSQDERESVLQRGRQEVLNQTKERLASHLEMLHLSIMRKQETITKDTSMLLWKFIWLCHQHNLEYYQYCLMCAN